MKRANSNYSSAKELVRIPELVPELCLMGAEFNLRTNACEYKEKTIWFEDQKVVHGLTKGNVKHVERQLGYVHTIIFMGFLWISLHDP